MLAGELCTFTEEYEDVFDRFTSQPVLFLDNFLSSAYPRRLPPKELLSITAKQLPPYGSNLDTAVQDLGYYQKTGYGVLVLTGNRRRGEILQGMLRDGGVSSFLAYPADHLPQRNQILLTDGALPAGVEYPELQLAILTEGQLAASPTRRKAPAAKKKGDQPAEAQFLHRPEPRRPGGSRISRNRPLCGYGADEGGRRCQGLRQNRLSGHRRAVRPGHTAGSGQQIHRRRRGHAHPAQQAGRGPVAEGQGQGAPCRQRPGGGSDQALRRTPAPHGLRFFRRFAVADRI